MNSLTRHYHTFTADERARLFAAALARGDEQELERLDETCPHRCYEGDDIEYTSHKFRLWIMALMHAQQLEQKKSVFFGAISLLAAHERGETEEDYKRMQFYKEMLKSVYSDHQAQEEAWKRFCADIGAEPDGLLRAYCIEPNPLWRIAVLVAERMKPIAPFDSELVEANLESFRERWTR
jgi:hypothetical protein